MFAQTLFQKLSVLVSDSVLEVYVGVDFPCVFGDSAGGMIMKKKAHSSSCLLLSNSWLNDFSCPCP